MLDAAVRIACLSNGCCACSRGGDARRATSTCARRKRVIDAGAFRTARGSASGGIGRSTRLLAVRTRRLAACTECERHCTEGVGTATGLSSEASQASLPQAPASTQGKRFPRSADMPSSLPSASTILTRSTRSALGRKHRGCGESNHDGLVTCLAVVSDDTVFSGSLGMDWRVTWVLGEVHTAHSPRTQECRRAMARRPRRGSLRAPSP